MLPSGSWVGLNAYDAVPNLRAIAQLMGITLSEKPTDQEIQEQLFDRLGKAKVFGENVVELEVSLDDHEPLLDLLEWSGLLERIEVRSIHGSPSLLKPVVCIITGATVNWMTRRVDELVRQLDKGVIRLQELYLLGGTRPCDSDTEKGLDVVQQLMKGDVYPSEQEVLQELLRRKGLVPSPLPEGFTPGKDLDANLEQFFVQFWAKLPDVVLYAPINAGALGAVMQVRHQAKKAAVTDFDCKKRPGFYFSQDDFNLARNAWERSNPRRYQHPRRFLSALPRLTKELHLLKQ